MTNPLSSLSSTSKLNDAKTLVQEYRVGAEPPGTSEEQVRGAMQLYKSAFHPDSGELQNVFGRMSFQVIIYEKICCTCLYCKRSLVE